MPRNNLQVEVNEVTANDKRTITITITGDGDRMSPAGKFFNDAAREIFARVLEFGPDPTTLITWLSNEKQIDRMVADTELAHYIDPKAKGQRDGVLSTLAQLGKTLRLCPGLMTDCKEVVDLITVGKDLADLKPVGRVEFDCREAEREMA
jgi:hypothetical protein